MKLVKNILIMSNFRYFTVLIEFYNERRSRILWSTVYDVEDK